mmetsp:Transcript_8796/g.36366  ORF Transcript_8796/g.36366 Transcript_8796/m.36366 type:complete len:221 (-) Transcript_8796:529-1191(-)
MTPLGGVAPPANSRSPPSSAWDDASSTLTTTTSSSSSSLRASSTAEAGAGSGAQVRKHAAKTRPERKVSSPKTAMTATMRSRWSPRNELTAMAPAMPTCWIPVSMETVLVSAASSRATVAAAHPKAKPHGDSSTSAATARAVGCALPPPDGHAKSRTSAATTSTTPTFVATFSSRVPHASLLARMRHPNSAGVVATTSVTKIAAYEIRDVSSCVTAGGRM